MPRLARGCRCYAAFEGDSVVGYGWLSTGPEWIGELQLLITPGSSEGYVWNCVTLPEHRRRGVYRSILARLPELARRDGLHRLWTGSVAIPGTSMIGFLPDRSGGPGGYPPGPDPAPPPASNAGPGPGPAPPPPSDAGAADAGGA